MYFLVFLCSTFTLFASCSSSQQNNILSKDLSEAEIAIIGLQPPPNDLKQKITQQSDYVSHNLNAQESLTSSYITYEDNDEESQSKPFTITFPINRNSGNNKQSVQSIVIPLPSNLDDKTGIIVIEDHDDGGTLDRRTLRAQFFSPNRIRSFKQTFKEDNERNDTKFSVNRIQTSKKLSQSKRIKTLRRTTTEAKAESSTISSVVFDDEIASETTTFSPETVFRPKGLPLIQTNKKHNNTNHIRLSSPTADTITINLHARQLINRRLTTQTPTTTKRIITTTTTELPTTSTTELLDLDENTDSTTEFIDITTETPIRRRPIGRNIRRNSRRSTTTPTPTTTETFETELSTTESPTTEWSTTQKQTTQRPTTQRSTTQRPTTQRPTTQRQTTQRQTTQRQTTQRSTTQRTPQKLRTRRTTTTQRPTTTTRIATTIITTPKLMTTTGRMNEFTELDYEFIPLDNSTQMNFNSNSLKLIKPKNRTSLEVDEEVTQPRPPGTPQIPNNFGVFSSGNSLNVPGSAGLDYPTYDKIPVTNFDCREHIYPGFYSDQETGCQAYHSCNGNLRASKHTFLCPNGTIFSQEYLICDWWYNVKCEDSPIYYPLNKEAFSSTIKSNSTKFKTNNKRNKPKMTTTEFVIRSITTTDLP